MYGFEMPRLTSVCTVASNFFISQWLTLALIQRCKPKHCNSRAACDCLMRWLCLHGRAKVTRRKTSWLSLVEAEISYFCTPNYAFCSALKVNAYHMSHSLHLHTETIYFRLPEMLVIWILKKGYKGGSKPFKSLGTIQPLGTNHFNERTLVYKVLTFD